MWNYLIQYKKDIEDNIKVLPIPRKKELNKIYLKSLENASKVSETIWSKYLKYKEYNIVLNDFPYDLEKNIEHYVLWSRKRLENDSIEKILKQEFKNLNIVFFENPEYLKSIKDIFHIHIFVKLL